VSQDVDPFSMETTPDNLAVLLDHKVLEKIYASLGGEILGNVSEKLSLTGERTFRELDKFLAKGDATGVREAAHLMKGAALHLGLSALSAMSRKIEKMATAGELEQIRDEVEPFRDLFERSFQALREWKSQEL
jgi:hypothetical protein